MRRLKVYLPKSYVKKSTLIELDLTENVLTQKIPPLYNYDFGGSMRFTHVNPYHTMIICRGPSEFGYCDERDLTILDAAEEQRYIRYPIGHCVITPSFVLWRSRRENSILFCRYCGRHNMYHENVTREYHKKYMNHAAECSRKHRPYITAIQLLCFFLMTKSKMYRAYGTILHKDIMNFMRKGARCDAWNMFIDLH